MNFIQVWSNFLDLLFPTEEIKKEKIKKLLQGRMIFYSKTFSVHFFPYRNIWINRAITSLKFKNNKIVARFFGEVLYENLPEILLDLQISHNFYDPLLINIPISKKRKRTRGYNQCDLIIRRFIQLGGNNFVHWEKSNLIKIKETQPQTTLHTKTDRLRNPLNSFKLRHPEKIKNKNIILFDDVHTTGATIREAKKILRQVNPPAGGKKILVVTIAK